MVETKNIMKMFKIILVLNLMFLLLFSFIYFTIGQVENSFGGIDGKMTSLDAFYFSMTTQTTVGYGDIYPKSNTAKMWSIIQQFLFLMEFVAFTSGVVLIFEK